MQRTKDGRSSEILGAIEEMVIYDLLHTSEAELLAEARAEAEDVSAETEKLRASMLQRVIEFRQRKLVQVRSKLAARHGTASCRVYPRAAVMRQRLAELWNQEPGLSLAFRNRQSQSDEDLKTLWDDLMELGFVSDHDINSE